MEVSDHEHSSQILQQNRKYKKTNILFLGNSVYWAGMDGEVKYFVQKFNLVLVKKIVNFSTAAMKESTYPQMKKLTKNRGLNLSDKEFHSKGAFAALHKGKPDAADITAVKKFARECMKEKK